MKITNVQNFRSILKDELAARCARNARYSLRAFARDLEMAPARLSDVLRGRYGLSQEAALKVGGKLGWTQAEQSHFVDLVQREHARAKKDKIAATERLRALVPQHQQLTLDAFTVIADWYHYAILELCLVEGFQSNSKWIARKLGISLHTVDGALARLKRLELIEEFKGQLRPCESFTASPTGVPSEALKKFHTQILEKAISAIRFQSIDERDFSAIILAFNRKQIREAQEMITQFRRAFDKKFGKSKKKNAVYCLSTQFFRLQENIN